MALDGTCTCTSLSGDRKALIFAEFCLWYSAIGKKGKAYIYILFSWEDHYVLNFFITCTSPMAVCHNIGIGAMCFVFTWGCAVIGMMYLGPFWNMCVGLITLSLPPSLHSWSLCTSSTCHFNLSSPFLYYFTWWVCTLNLYKHYTVRTIVYVMLAPELLNPSFIRHKTFIFYFMTAYT